MRRCMLLSLIGLAALGCAADDSGGQGVATEVASGTEDAQTNDSAASASTSGSTSTTDEPTTDSPTSSASDAWPPQLVEVEDFDDPYIRASIHFGPAENLEVLLLTELEAAATSIRSAVYNIRLQEVGNALLAATQAGLTVEVAMDQGQMDLEYNTLDDWMTDVGIDLTGIVNDASPSAIMHNKFTIIDSTRVLTGSVNYSTTGLTQSDEDLLVIDDPEVASLFEAEFAELLAGSNSSHAPDPSAPLQVFFSPEDDPRAALVSAINAAQSTIHAKLFLATMGDIEDALVAARGRGVEVVLIMDADQASGQDFDETVETAGARVIRVPKAFPEEIHDKMCVIDSRVVLLGSYNWTATASFSNDENLVRIDSEAIGSRVEAEVLGALRRYDSSFSPAAYGWPDGDRTVRFELVNLEDAESFDVALRIGDSAYMMQDLPGGAHVPTHKGLQLELPAGEAVTYSYEIRGSAGDVWAEPVGAHRIEVPYVGLPVAYDAFFEP